MVELTQEYVLSLFDYRDGKLFWKKARANNCVKEGDEAGALSCGYYRVGMNGKNYYNHRLIFLYHNGYLPDFLDHVDGDPLNNDISNLREATLLQNSMNQKKTKHHNGKPTHSQYKGVTWNEVTKQWRARIMIDGKSKHLGYFTSEIEAAESYNVAAIKHFGNYAHLNTIPQPLHASTPTPIYGDTNE